MPRPGTSRALIWSNERGRQVGALALVLMAVLAGPYAASPGHAAAPSVPLGAPQLPAADDTATVADDFLLLSLWVENSCLTDELEVKARLPRTESEETRFYLPLMAVCTPLGLDASRNQAGVVTVGTPGSRRHVVIDPAKGLVTVKGTTAPLEPGTLLATEEELYVSPEVLGQWLDCEFLPDRPSLSVKVLASAPFPVQERAERERRAAKLRVRTPEMSGPPPVEAEYQNWAGPFVDQTLALTAGEDSRLDSFTQISGDVMKAGYDLSVSASAPGGIHTRLMFSRYDPDGRMLGALGATALTGGELSSPALALVAPPQQLRGLSISTYPLTSESLFDRRNITGYAGPDWDVQLYRGEVLLDYQKTDANGRWEFRDVPLLYGNNELRVVLHGPHGEVREEQVQAAIGAAMLQPGKRYYRLIAGEQETGGTLVALQGDWSLRRELSMAWGATSVEYRGETHRYLTTGLRGYRGNVFGTLDLAMESGGGHGLRSSLQTRLGAVSAVAEYSQAWDLASQAFSGGARDSGYLARLRLDNIPMPDNGFWLPAALEWRQERYDSGRRRMEVTSRLSARRVPWRFSNFLSWSRDSSAGERSEDLRGTFLASRYGRGRELTADVMYSLMPDTQIENATMAYRRDLEGARFLSVALQYEPPAGRTRLELGLSRRSGSRSWGVTTGIDSASGAFLGVSVSNSFGRLPHRGWRRTDEPLTSQAAASARVFLDHNGNGLLDAGEPRLKNVGFFVNDSSGQVVTDSRGLALITGLPAFEPVRVGVSRGTLEDAMWVPREDNVVVRGRPGAIVCLDLAVTPTGEITGTVYAQRDGQRCVAAAVELELVNAAGEVVKRARTAYDGFYSFSEIPVGSYTLRTRLEERLEASFRSSSCQVVIEGEDPFVDGVDLNLEPTPELLAAQERRRQAAQ